MTDLDRAKAELAATRARSLAFATQLDQALRRIDALEAALSRLQAQAEQQAASRATEATLQAEIAALQHHRDEARALRQSTSWRLTRPLRALSRLLGRKRAVAMPGLRRRFRGKAGDNATPTTPTA